MGCNVVYSVWLVVVLVCRWMRFLVCFRTSHTPVTNSRRKCEKLFLKPEHPQTFLGAFLSRYIPQLKRHLNHPHNGLRPLSIPREHPARIPLHSLLPRHRRPLLKSSTSSPLLSPRSISLRTVLYPPPPTPPPTNTGSYITPAAIRFSCLPLHPVPLPPVFVERNRAGDLPKPVASEVG